MHSDKKKLYITGQLELLSFFMIELSLVEYEMLKFCPSMLAASAIYTAQCTMNGFKSWNKCCKLHTKYFFYDLNDFDQEIRHQFTTGIQGSLIV